MSSSGNEVRAAKIVKLYTQPQGQFFFWFVCFLTHVEETVFLDWSIVHQLFSALKEKSFLSHTRKPSAMSSYLSSLINRCCFYCTKYNARAIYLEFKIHTIKTDKSFKFSYLITCYFIYSLNFIPLSLSKLPLHCMKTS